MTVLAVRAPIAWLGPGRLAEDIAIVLQGGRVAFAGPARDLAVTAAGERGRETLSGHPAPPEPDQEIRVDGFVIPGVVDRHVHIGLSDPGAVVAAGVTAVRDLGWPPEVVFPLADASESPSFNGPLIRAVGPMITCRGGYPTRSGWAPPRTGRGPSRARGISTPARDHGTHCSDQRSVERRALGSVGQRKHHFRRPPQVADRGHPGGDDGSRVGQPDVDMAIDHSRDDEAVDADLLVGLGRGRVT